MRLLIILAILLLSACATTPGGPVSGTSVATSNQLYQRALAAYRNKQLMKSFEIASASLEQNPANARAYELVALINQRLGRTEAAATAFRKALALAPDDAGVHNNYGTFLCSRQSYAKAQEQYHQAATMSGNPQPEIAYTNAGLCAKRSGDLDQAKELFQQAIHQNPGQPTALYQLALLSLEKNRPVEASTYLDQYLSHAVHTAKTLLLGARIENSLGNPAGVNSYIRKLQSAFPKSQELVAAQALQPLTPVATAAAQPAPTPLYDAHWILAQNPSHYTLQVSSSADRDSAEAVAGRLTPPTAIYRQNGTHTWYNVIHGDFSDITTARNALQALKRADPGSQAWVREFGAIQRGLKNQSPTS